MPVNGENSPSIGFICVSFRNQIINRSEIAYSALIGTSTILDLGQKSFDFWRRVKRSLLRNSNKKNICTW